MTEHELLDEAYESALDQIIKEYNVSKPQLRNLFINHPEAFDDLGELKLLLEEKRYYDGQ